MAEIPQNERKRYYTIGEVAELFDIKASVIRFWETEFDFLNPHKTAKGDRRFTKTNLEQLQLIHHLLKERGFTLEGAKKEITAQKKTLGDQLAAIDRLKAVKKRLIELREKL